MEKVSIIELSVPTDDITPSNASKNLIPLLGKLVIANVHSMELNRGVNNIRVTDKYQYRKAMRLLKYMTNNSNKLMRYRKLILSWHEDILHDSDTHGITVSMSNDSTITLRNFTKSTIDTINNINRYIGADICVINSKLVKYAEAKENTCKNQ